MDRDIFLRLFQLFGFVCSIEESQWSYDWYYGDDFVATEDDINFVQSFVDSMNLTDELDRLAISTRLQYCPMSNLCHISTAPLQTYFLSTYYGNRFCCAPCSCDVDCIEFGNCCPDMYRNISENWNGFLKKTKYRCIPTMYSPATYVRIEIYGDVWAVAVCLNRTNDAIVRGCEDQLQKFTPDSHVPVTDMADGTVYRNIFCAKCNNVPDTDISGWNIKLNCSGFQERVFKPPHYDIMEDCFLEFFSPVNVSNHWKCPSTDYTIAYEHLSEQPLGKLCLLFQSAFNFKYRNVYCYLLMDPESNLYQCTFYSSILFSSKGSYDYSYLLDFNTLRSWNIAEKKHENTLTSTKNCSNSEVPDNFQMKCLPVICEEYQIYRNDSCQSRFMEEPPTLYDITLELRSETLLPKNLMGGSLTNDIVDGVKFGLKNSALGSFLLCSTKYFISDAVNDNSYDNTLYVQVSMMAPNGHASLVTEATKIRFPTLIVRDNDFLPLSFKMTLNFKHVLDCHENDPSYCASYDKRFHGFKKVYSWTEPDMLSPCAAPDIVANFDLKDLNICPKVCFEDFNVKHFTEIRKGKGLCLQSHPVCFQNGEYVMKESKLCTCYKTYTSKISVSQADDSFGPCATPDVPYPIHLTSFIGTVLSCLSSIIVMVIYFSSPSGRTLPAKLNMTLSCFLFVAQFLFQFGIGVTGNEIICKVLGLFIHFSWLLVFFWMNVCTFHMARAFAFKFEVTHTKNQNTYAFFRYNVYCFGMAFSLIIVNIVTSMVSTDFQDVGYGGCLCYISSSTMVLFTLFIPAFSILISNFIMFLCVIIKIKGLALNSAMLREKRSYLLIYCKMSTITGISWMSLFLNEFFKNDILGYISTLMASFLGVFILLAFFSNRRVTVHIKERIFGLIKGSKTNSSSSDLTSKGL